MASYQENMIHVYSSTEGFEPSSPNPDEAEESKKPEQQQQEDTKARRTPPEDRTASKPDSGPVGVATSSSSLAVARPTIAPIRTTSPLRSRSPLRSTSPGRTRKFFQEKVHEVVRRARYGQWDFDFSPRSARSTGDLNSPPWGPVPAKDIFSEILRPAYEDPEWKYTKQRSVNRDGPRSLPTQSE